jgi:hypothetical protein
MRVYRASSWQGVSGRRTADKRHRPKQQVFALPAGDEALVFTAGEIEAAGRLDANLGGDELSVLWDSMLRAPRACAGDGTERPLIPMFWFAANLHFARVRTPEHP